MPAARRRLYLASLGCPKNRVDSEVMLAVAARAGWEPTSDAETADAIVVNTCGFIDAAKQESIETILELAEHKRTGHCRTLIVTGCLSQRYPEELATELSEVDHFLGSSDMLALARVLQGGADRVAVGDPAAWLMGADDPRALGASGVSAYVKISEGCNRRCSFCVIPELRGPQRSRATADVVREVRALVDAGIREINLVAQDSVAYGRDRTDGATLAGLAEQIAEVAGLYWLRIHYLYPERLDDRLLDLWANHPRVVAYVDLPLQHAASTMLQRMRRGHDARRLHQLVERVRTRIPEAALRSAFIVGHPGETRAEFLELERFVRWAELDHVGVFCYSNEEGTAAAGLAGKVAPRIADARARRLLEAQRSISRRKNEARIGTTLDVLVEGPSEEHELVLTGRHAGQAPDIDGVVYLSGGEPRPGEIRRVSIAGATDYDLLGEVLEEPPICPAPERSPALALSHRSGDGRRVHLRTTH